MAPPAAPTFTIDLATERDAARLVVAVPAGATELTLWRVGPSGVAAGVRGWYPGTLDAAPATVIVRDYEAPLGVALDYFATVGNVDGTSPEAGPVPFTITSAPGDDPWLVDMARPLNSVRVLVESFAALQYGARAGVHAILGRRAPVVTSDIATTPRAALRFATLDEETRRRVRDVLGAAVPMLLRTPPEQGVGNVYLQPLEWTEERASRIALYAERRFDVDVAQVDRPDPELYVPRPPSTYESLEAAYATYAALLAARPTYDDALYDYATAADQPAPPWPPEDV